MKYKIIILLVLTVFIMMGIAGVCASDANDTMVASDDVNQMELSSNDVITEDNLGTSEGNATLAQANEDETLSAEGDSQILGEGNGTYEDLINEIGNGGNKILTKSYYSYTGGNTIEIRTSGYINGNGAVIDMNGSTIRAFKVSASDVTIRNLTIKNADFNGDGGAIYFSVPGTVENCTFVGNKANGGGAMYEGIAINCRFIENHANGYGGAINGYNHKSINCTFIGNSAGDNGGALSGGEAHNCSFISNVASRDGGAINNGKAYNCNFTGNRAVKEGGAKYGGNAINCTFINNTAYAGAALSGGEAHNCNFTDNHAAQDGGAVFKCKAYDCTFKDNTARYGGAFYENEAYNCNFINNTASENGGAVFNGNAYNCTFTDNHAVKEGGAMCGGASVLNILKTASDTLYNTNIMPIFTVSKSIFRFDLGDRLLFNLTYDNKNFDGYNTTITITKDGSPVGVYYALSGSDEGWYADLSSEGVYAATLSMEQYAVNPITVYVITGMNEGKYIVLSGEIGSGGGVINLQHDYYVYDYGSSIEITTPNTVIEGNGAVIDMAGSNIRAFTVKAANVTIRNLTIKNVDFNGDGGAVYFSVPGTVENCTFIGNKANGGGAMYEGIAINCRFIENHANGYGGAINGFNHKSINCTFIGNSAGDKGGALSGGEAHNCSFISNVASRDGGAINNGKAYNCNFTGNSANGNGGAMVGGAAFLCILKTASDTLYNTNVPTFTVSKPVLRFDFGDRLLFNLTCDNKNYDGYNTTITITKDGSPVGVYYALSGSDEGWSVDLSSGVYVATLGMEQYAVNPITVYVITGMNEGTYIVLSDEIGSGGGVINLQHDYYVYDFGSSIEITTPNTVIEGNGAVIDMEWSNIRALTVSASNVTIRNLTIKNVNFNGDGGAIYFSVPGTVENCNFINNTAYSGAALKGGEAYNCNFTDNHAAQHGGAAYNCKAYDCTFIGNNANNGGAMYGGHAINCTFINNHAYAGAALNGGEAYNCNFTDNHADQDGGAVYNSKAYDCTFKGNTARYGGAFYQNDAYNCNFINNTAIEQGGAIFLGNAYNCTFTDNRAVKEGGAMYGGTAGLCFLNTSSDTLHNTNIIPIFTVSKPVLRFDFGDKLLFNLTCDNKNYDGYNTTITITKDGNPVGVYYALSGSDEGWSVDLSPEGVYVATLSIEQYTVNPITVYVITGMNEDAYSVLSGEIGSGGGVINLQHDYYVYDYGSSIEITTPNTVIEGNGAVIDMVGSNIRALTVSASNVTIRNLTIKNANFNGDGGAIYFSVPGTVENCTFIGNKANGGGAMYEGIAINCRFIENHANGYGGAINGFNHKSINCTFIGNSAGDNGGALSGGEAHNCSFISNVASRDGGAINDGKVYNCNFTGNSANGNGGAMVGGAAVLCIFKTASDTLYNTNVPTFTVSKSIFRFDLGDKLLFNLTCDNKNYDGYNTTITLTKDGNPVGVYYALSGSDEGWYSDLSPEGVYMATLSMEQYAVNPITVYIITGNAGTYSGLSGEIGSGGGVINLQHDYYTYDNGSSIEITTPNTVIDGNGAVIDMAGSNIRAFTVNAADVTIRNLTIKNVNFNGDGGAIYFSVSGTVENCTFIGNSANGGGAMYEGIAINCRFIENHANRYGGAINGFNHKSINCTFISNSALYSGGALSGGEAYNCSFVGNSASQGGAINEGKAYNCNFTGNRSPVISGAMYEGAAFLCILKTSSDKLYHTNVPTFTVSKSPPKFISGDKLLFNLTYDNKNFDGCNTTITISKDGNPVGVYYALSGSDGGWYVDLSPGIYKATLSLGQYVVDQVTVDIIIGNVSTYSGLSGEIGSGGGYINLQYDYYIFDYGSSIEITTPNTVIDGNGAIIDMGGSNIRAFTVNASDVTIRNLTIINANINAGSGGAIYFNSSGTVENCNFANNFAEDGGGAINFGESGIVTNCNFADNQAYCGGAIKMNSGTVTNCYFANNHVIRYGNGGAINGNCKAINCTFKENYAGGHAGAMYGGSAVNCTFTGNSAYSDCGAMYGGSAVNCTFTGNSAGGYGGALWHCSSVNCTFIENCGGYGGGAMADGSALNSIFSGNYADEFNLGYPDCLRVGDLVLQWDANDFTTTYGSDEKCPIRLSMDFINYDAVIYKDGSEVKTYHCLSNDGLSLDLPIGIYTAKLTVTYPGLTLYSKYITLTVNMATPRIEVQAYDATYPGSAVVNVKSDIAGVYAVKVGGVSQNVTLIANEGMNVTFTGFAANEEGYIVNVTNLDLENCTSVVNDTVKVIVHKATPIIEVLAYDATYPGSAVVNVKSDVGGLYAVNVGGVSQNVALIANEGMNVTFTGFAANEEGYTVNVTNLDLENCTAVVNDTTVIKIRKGTVKIISDEIITIYNADKTLSVTLTDSNGNPIGGANITVDLNGDKNYTTDSKGQVRISTKGLAVNTYEVLIAFNGTDNYLNGSKTTRVIIYKESSIVDAKPLTTVYNVYKYLVVGLKDKDGKPIRNADAYMVINGVTYKCRSDNAGNARLIIRLNPGKYVAKITFGDVNYVGFTQYVTVIVKKATPKLTAKKKTFKKSKKVKKYTVTLKDNNGKAMKKVKLTIKVGKKTYKAKTNAKGKAVFKIKKLSKKGKYKATVTYKGDKCYNKVTKKVKITIR